MNSTSLGLLEEILIGSVRSLFESVGTQVAVKSSDGKSPPTAEMACSIGFAGETWRGCMALSVQRALVKATLPREAGPTPSAVAVSDWLGELTNQLLGRIKNQLLTYRTNFAITIPSVVTGESLIRSRGHLPIALIYSLETPAGSGVLYFDAAVAPGAELDANLPSEANPNATEGDVRLF